jgi:uncharacterized protein
MLRHESYPNYIVADAGVVSILDCDTLSLATGASQSQQDALNAIRRIDPAVRHKVDLHAGADAFFPVAVDTPSDDDIRLRARQSSFAPFILGQRSYLNRLTINIANSCNLWCSYCYADHGHYHDTKHLMKPDRALRIFEQTSRLYDGIGNIHFFGGEPLLNPKTIDAVCVAAKARFPDIGFAVTTNGTLATPEILDVLARHSIALTISIDGPAPVHDAQRPTVSGDGSHAKICQSVERFTQRGIEWSIECTFNKAHLEADVSVSDLLRYFDAEFNEPVPHIAWSYVPLKDLVADDGYTKNGVFRDDLEEQQQSFISVDHLITQFRDAARLSMQNIAAGSGGVLSFVQDTLTSLQLRRKSDAYCPAFSSQISIGSNGDIYPCFMFFGDPRMCIGNIDRANIDVPRAQEIWRKYSREFSDSATGTQRWFRNLGFGCIAGDYISTGTFSNRLYYDIQEAIVEEVLLGIAQFEATRMAKTDSGSLKAT